MGADGPRVFQPGTLTVVRGRDGISVYAGGTLLTMAFGVSGEQWPPRVLFRAARDPGEQTVLDEETRALAACLR